MKRVITESLSDARVAFVKTASRGYEQAGAAEAEARRALARLTAILGWADTERGPFGKIIAKGARVLIKPNFVMHENQGASGIDPLITHPSIVRVAAQAALQAGAAEVTIGDAPVQGCDFDKLLSVTRLDEWANDLAKKEERFQGIKDFRRTTCRFEDGVRVASENLVPEDRFVLFDLGAESLLEPITDQAESFRVTCYDPRLLAKTHAPGKHQYLVARDIIDADVVINLPKLKTHKKAGVTCALKNLIGINGNKEYLPHHRLGGSEAGGDCYPGSSSIKRALEYTLDKQNQASSFRAGRAWQAVATQLDRAARLMGDRVGVEGSWSGNDTIWRTCLDLNRILLYGRGDATIGEEPQRRVIHLVDAVVAGQGDGPLAPDPLALGLIFTGGNAAAVDWAAAYLLGYKPEMIPVSKHSFDQFRWPIASFSSSDVIALGDIGSGRADDVLRSSRVVDSIIHPAGWRDAAIDGRRSVTQSNFVLKAVR